MTESSPVTLLPATSPPLHESLPALVAGAGDHARFAWDEYFAGTVRNPHTRAAYLRAVRLFLGWCESQALGLSDIMPGHVSHYLDQQGVGVATKKLYLSAIRGFLDKLVLRHVLLLNPAACVKGERYEVREGKTPMISIEQSRVLLAALDTSTLVGLRDRAILGTLSFTAARSGAVARLKVKSFIHDGVQWLLRMEEKGGKSREIPVRHDLAGWILDYMRQAGVTAEEKDLPLFRSAFGRTGRLTYRPMNYKLIWDMVKRRLGDANLPGQFSPHSFRVKTITDLLEQGIPMEDVQNLAGHADPRTTRVYDRRSNKVSRSIVERISL